MMIETTNLSVSLGRREILSSVGMTAHPGEMTVIVGPNGSGKTTLMNTLSGDLAYRGRVMFNGISLSSMKPWQMAVLRAVLPQATTLAFPFTVHEVVRLGLTNGRSGALPDAVARLPERALARVGLENFSGRLYQELSGGEQQRVQLARILCQVWSPVLEGQARYLFLDEPVSSLDVKHQLLIMNVARDYARRGGGVIAVLHDLNLAAMFADRIVMMHRGRIAASGTAAGVLTEETLATIFDCRLAVGFAETGVPFVLPQSAA
jgi:iron complex transport system ATP-binding protein